MTKESEFISVAQAAKLLKVTSTRIRDYITGKRLPATQVGRAYVLRRADVLKFEKREPGRPKKA